MKNMHEHHMSLAAALLGAMIVIGVSARIYGEEIRAASSAPHVIQKSVKKKPVAPKKQTSKKVKKPVLRLAPSPAVQEQQQTQKTNTIPVPGYAELVAVEGGIAASLSRDDVIQVIDIQKPESPMIVRTIDTPAFAEAAYQKDDLLYIADNRELRILDSAGTLRGRHPLQDFWTSAFAVDGGYAYLASGSDFRVVDVRAPERTRDVATMTLTGRAPTHVIVHEGYAYVVESLGGLNIVDVRVPERPKALGVLPFESHTVGFGIEGSYAYVGRVVSTKSTETGYKQMSVFEVIDISRPASAAVVGSLQLPTDIRGLNVRGNRAYVIGSYPYRLTPIDVSVPSHPTILLAAESIMGSADLQDIAMGNGYAFLADGYDGLRIVNLADPANPKHVTDIDLGGRAFHVHRGGDLLYVSVEQKYFNLADVRAPDNPKPLFSERFTASYKYTNIVLKGKKVYFNGGGARIYDIADPTAPKKILTKPVEADSIQIQGTKLYSTIGEIGLLVYDISDPAAPVSISRTPFSAGIPRDLSADGRWAVAISNSPYSITAFDISDPKNPVQGRPYLYQTYPNTATVKDGIVYVARGEQGVDILSIRPDGSLEPLTRIQTKGHAHHVTVIGSKAFVVRDGADIYDVRDPRDPLFLAHIGNRGEANRVTIDGEYLYIADGYAGITIAKIP